MAAVPIAAQIERAWHLLTVLMRIGQPASPAELASRCALSAAPAPDLVELLCRIPRSPLLLTDDGFVTASETAISALGEFVVNSVTRFVPRDVIRVAWHPKACGDEHLKYSRKRKARSFEISLPCVKRRLFVPPGEGLEESTIDDGMHKLCMARRSQKASTEVHFSLGVVLHGGDLFNAMSSMRETSSTVSQGSICPPSLGNSCFILSRCNVDSIEHIMEAKETGRFSGEKGAIIVHKDMERILSDTQNSPHLETSNTPHNNSNGGLQTKVIAIGPSLAEKATNKPTEYNFSQMATQVALGSETSTCTPVQASSDQCFPSTLTIPISQAAGPVENMGFSSTPCVQRKYTLTRIGAFSLGCLEPAVKVKTGTYQRGQRKSLEKPKILHQLASTVQLVNSVVALQNKEDCNTPDEGTKKYEMNIPMTPKLKKSHKHNVPTEEITMTPKLKKSHKHNVPTEEIRVDAVVRAKTNLEPKLLPSFESFLVEEEEGSGGYGIVYRAQRKTDGKIFAIKCPHANAHVHHINNELKMLQRFGGRNFVIKFEGSFRHKELECFVLEHVEHDRPEALKKEIDVFELQWYGYCMFKALASLHKQGIVHRDVKPGNFLFSRKVNKGYLIDFNLANDLHLKFCRNSKSGTNLGVNVNQSLTATSASLVRPRQVSICTKLDAACELKKPLIPKNMKKRSNKCRLDAFHDTSNTSKQGSQAAADVSGVTSAKDATSTRTPSAERLKQPMPCKGRKALISFVHEALKSPNHKAVTVPSSQRKRVAAPIGKQNRRLLLLTPMPLHSGGNAVAGSGMFKTRGNGKQRREGPCVGTKGFRAPEVLFRSYHQGCKVDIWSAGVTLLYLVIGRTPFGGYPEQNIKEIAKLRGSEDLWEVAKLHGCESSFPTELFDVRSLESMELRDWCVLNTKRPEFLELIPESLLDLVDKCLTVNPRLRITAEEALMHDFFGPCHQRLRKQRFIRRATSLDSSIPTNEEFKSLVGF